MDLNKPIDEFEKNELIGRNILKEVLVSKFNATNMVDGSKYDQLDYYADISNKRYGFEVKTRNKLYSDMCLEELKWNGMKSQKEKLGLNEVYYVNIVDGYIYFWSSSTINKYGSEPYVQGMPKTTCDSTKHNFIGKRVIGLPIIRADYKYKL